LCANTKYIKGNQIKAEKVILGKKKECQTN
jgi:hypothetical protein